MTVRSFATALAALALATVPLAASAAGQPRYKLVRTTPLGAPDRWDYLTFDPASHRVYVAHADRLTVIDGRSGAVLGEVTGIAGGTHGIGLSAGKGYTDDGRAGVAVAFDPQTFRVLARVPAQPDADGITVEPKTGHVFVADGDSGKLTVIDPHTDKVVATVDGGGGLEFVVADGDGKIYVNGAEKREMVRIDARTNAVDARWPIPKCESPHGLAIDPATHRLFVSCVNKLLIVLNSQNGSVVATLPIGAGSDAVAFDPSHRRVFSSNGDGTLTVISAMTPNSYAVLETLKTQVTGRTMTVDPQTGRLYLAAASIDTAAPVPTGVGGRPGRPPLKPGSLSLLIYDPVP